MLEWRPKLVTLILVLTIVAMLAGLAQVVGLTGLDLGHVSWD
jgi:hypothetical protein